MTNPELEEKLREAACFGDIEGVKELIQVRVLVIVSVCILVYHQPTNQLLTET